MNERHGEGLGCRDVDLRGGIGVDEVGRSFARQLVNPWLGFGLGDFGLRMHYEV